MLRATLRAAALAGIVAGVLLTALQAWSVAPLIRDAERIEQAAGHDEAHDAWQPGSDTTRVAATAVANVVLATGFALMLAGAMALRGARGWRAGIAWGVAGYVVVFVAPSLGLPPSLPGVAEAPLDARTAWWLVAAGSSAGGLALIVFGRGIALRALGLALLVVPHAIGAPQPPRMQDPQATRDLARAFVRNAYLANAALWLALGAIVGALRATPSARMREVTPPSGVP
jgi:cobalt transporter subunit CbtA